MALRKKVLIVDDEEDLTWTLNKKFSKDSNKFELFIASNGREALEILSQIPIDVVVTDIRMPEVNGLDLLIEIKKNYRTIKVIIMTAYGSPEIRSQAVKNGCLFYVEKPFEINELRSLILEAIEDKKGFAGTVSDFQLSDIVQLNCLGHLTSALYIRHDSEEGIIYFKDGNIVHTEIGGLEGENAFYHIISWKGGEFSVKRSTNPPKETIFKSWQNLLLEGLKRADEASDLVENQRENEKQHRTIMMKNELSKLLHLNGVLGVFLFNRGGFPVTSVVEQKSLEEDTENLGNGFDELFTSIEKFGESIKAKAVQVFMIEYGNYQIFINTIKGKSEFVATITDGKTNQGLLRLELRKVLTEIGKLV